MATQIITNWRSLLGPQWYLSAYQITMPKRKVRSKTAAMETFLCEVAVYQPATFTKKILRCMCFSVSFMILFRTATLQNTFAPTASDKYSNGYSCLAFPRYLCETRCDELFHYSDFFLELRLTFSTRIQSQDKINVLLDEERMQNTASALYVCAANTAVHD